MAEQKIRRQLADNIISTVLNWAWQDKEGCRENILALIEAADYQLSETLLSDTEIQKAFDNVFDKPVSFVHHPTQEEILLVRLRAVAQAQLEQDKKVEA